MRNLVYDISKCCNSKTWKIPQTLHEVLLRQQKLFICMGCGGGCDTEPKPAYLEKSKGVYSKIYYNDQKLYDEHGALLNNLTP